MVARVTGKFRWHARPFRRRLGADRLPVMQGGVQHAAEPIRVQVGESLEVFIGRRRLTASAAISDLQADKFPENGETFRAGRLAQGIVDGRPRADLPGLLKAQARLVQPQRRGLGEQTVVFEWKRVHVFLGVSNARGRWRGIRRFRRRPRVTARRRACLAAAPAPAERCRAISSSTLPSIACLPRSPGGVPRASGCDGPPANIVVPIPCR